MNAIVAIASPGSPEFAVIDFGNKPPTVAMTAGFENGNIVDCYGTLAAVGSYANAYSVTLFDISNPASPVAVKGGTLTTAFQIGALSMNDTYLLIGEYNGSRVQLFNIGKPGSPYPLSISDCAPSLNIISAVAIRNSDAVVSGDNNSVYLNFYDPASGAVPLPLLYNATGPSDYDGWTAVVATSAAVTAYSVSGNTANQLSEITHLSVFGSVAVAEIPEGGYYNAIGGAGSFTIYCYPSGSARGSIKTDVQKGTTSLGTYVKFLNNPAIAPFLAVANLTAAGIQVSYYFLETETDPPESSTVTYFTPVPTAEVTKLSTAYPVTLGITAFTPKPRIPPFPFPVPKWLQKILESLGF